MHLEVGESVELDLDAEGVLDAGRGDEERGTRRAGLLILLGSVYSFDKGRGGLI